MSPLAFKRNDINLIISAVILLGSFFLHLILLNTIGDNDYDLILFIISILFDAVLIVQSIRKRDTEEFRGINLFTYFLFAVLGIIMAIVL